MENIIRLRLIVCFLLSHLFLPAQHSYEGLCCPYPPGQSARPTSYEIYEDIQRLAFLGSVLYVAAHPDDENTHLISYFSNQLKANTAYLSLTRGDGGQNRIGSELRELLGLIRTQELLQARALDGGHQYFSRANDFGFSKNPAETLDIWDEEKILEDIVWIIRKTQPDIIINRFDHRTPGSTHGHHTASAILSRKAFDLAADPSAFPQQLDYVAPHQPKRLFLNQSYWFYGSEEAFEKVDKSNFVELDVAVHYYGKGKSNNEIAAASRTQHRCQGMGTTPLHGQHLEYLELIDGNPFSSKNDPFSGINTSWTRIDGSEQVRFIVEKITSEYDFSSPYKSLPALADLYKAIAALEDGYWKNIKLAELKQIVFDCTHLHAVALAEASTYTSGEAVALKVELVNQSPIVLRLLSCKAPYFATESDARSLTYNELLTISLHGHLPAHISYDNPYWLNETAGLGMYQVKEQQWRGLAETPNQLHVDILLEISGLQLEYRLPVSYRYTDAVVGQIYEAVKITPPVFVRSEAPVYLFPNQKSSVINIEVKAGRDEINAVLFPGSKWRCVPDSISVNLAKKGMSQTFAFELFPPDEQIESVLMPYVMMDNLRYDKTMHDIRYEHIPRQLAFLPASAKTVRIDLKTRGKKIAYLPGAGDEVPEQLRQIGFEVDVLNSGDLLTKVLQNYDVLILGVRAYNVIPDMAFRQQAIFDYAKSGGTVIVQYNTNTDLTVKETGPYPFQLSSDRVTKEDATVRILKPNHPLLNYPNKITEKDFDNWVQERGLYFPSSWDERYETILACNDPEESEKTSGLLYAKYGEGHFIYTGYSFFRQLPAGVPGAFRLFANLIAVGQMERP
jgi:LmbE family N-acetylglucosaminyl deacetylase